MGLGVAGWAKMKRGEEHSSVNMRGAGLVSLYRLQPSNSADKLIQIEAAFRERRVSQNATSRPKSVSQLSVEAKSWLRWHHFVVILLSSFRPYSGLHILLKIPANPQPILDIFLSISRG